MFFYMFAFWIIFANTYANIVKIDVNNPRFTHIIVSMKKFLKKYPLSLLVVSVILYLSFYRPSDDPMIKISNIDKLAHFCMYAGFCSVVWLEYFLSHSGVNRGRVIWLAVVAPIVFSGAIEVMQGYLTTYRGMDWYDLLYNTIGVVFALVFARYVLRPRVLAYKAKRNSGN